MGNDHLKSVCTVYMSKYVISITSIDKWMLVITGHFNLQEGRLWCFSVMIDNIGRQEHK